MLAGEFNRGQMSQQEVEQPNARSTMPNVTSQRRMAMSLGIRSVVVISREKVCFLTISSSHIDPYFFSIICSWPTPLALNMDEIYRPLARAGINHVFFSHRSLFYVVLSSREVE